MMKIPAYFLAVFAAVLLTGCWGSGTADSASSKEEAFREVMGYPPPVAVSEIRSGYYYMRVNYIRWLRFKCDADTLKKIEKEAGFAAASGGNPRWAPGFADRTQNPNAPDWWWELEGVGSFREFEREVSKDHGSDIAHIWVDPKAFTVFATRDVID